MELAKWYEAWKAQDTGGYQYTVDIPGSEGRASGVHASELSCIRRIAYSLLKTERCPPEGEVNMRMRFNLGHAVHAMLQHEFKLMCAWLNHSGTVITFQDEVRIDPELGGISDELSLYSSMDGLFSFWSGDFCYLRVALEIKTESGPQYEKLLSPRGYHMEQVNLYQRAIDVPLMWILYYNKSNSNYTKTEPPWLFQFDQGLWDKTVEPRIIKAHVHSAEQRLPDRMEGFYCRWCPFSWTCQPPGLHQQNYGPAPTIQQPGALR